MSSVWLKLGTITFLSCTVLAGQESGGVVWRDLGGALTIQCRPPGPDQETFTLKRVLKEDPVCVKDRESGKETTAEEFESRLKMTGPFHSLDILIQNLTADDTGLYLCIYTSFDQNRSQSITKRGDGSVLLVLTDKRKQCDPEDKDPVLISVVIAAAILVGVIMASLICVILKTKRSTVKPRHVATNDVYEDMRGTLRR